MLRVGILSLQGDFAAHARLVDRFGGQPSEVRTAKDLAVVEALILPGGESSAMLRLMAPEKLDERINDRIRAGMAVLATCAGVILLARKVEPDQSSLGLLDVDVARNAYGRQLHSSIESLRLDSRLGSPDEMEGVFIRAPRITRVGKGVTVLAWRDRDPVLVTSGRVLAATFHPELTTESRVHKYFLHLVGCHG
ncbi:MAG: pyridoxal 5'-phosphate synthase glutaminase subunit PdxT [Thermoanaerobaculales bacterium]|nr:pyridoxal 5'-phosphate synthase glutaminase subunit PdxT [Thermoanaerobaculales bacterium]